MYDFGKFKSKIDEIEEWLKSELKNIRTGRAAPTILDSVKAENYGVLTPINQMANISVEDARTLRITPYDLNQLKNIEKAITDANLGLSVMLDEAGIRLKFPELTQERRLELVKLAKDKLEEAKVAIRRERDEVWDDIQEKERNSEITEDEKYRYKEEMEEMTKNAYERLQKVFEEKEKSILEN